MTSVGLLAAPPVAMLFPTLSPAQRRLLIEIYTGGPLIGSDEIALGWRRAGRGGRRGERVCGDRALDGLARLGLVVSTRGRGRGASWLVAGLTLAGKLIAAELAREPETAGEAS